MAIEKYIIDKSDLSALLRGERLAIQPKGNIKGFCVEIAGNLTNGDVMMLVFNSQYKDEYTSFVHLEVGNGYFIPIPKGWWNAPYKADSEE